MRHPVLAILALAACVAACGAPRPEELSASDPSTLALVAGDALVVRGMSTDGPIRITKGRHVIPPLGEDGQQGVIVLEDQSGIVLDLTDVELRGTPIGSDRDDDSGFGIVLKNCRDVTIRGGKLGGYKVCIAAFDCERLVIEDVLFDGWYGQRLRSTTLAEDEADWLWPHENDAREWMTNYGAAIALENCRDTTIRRSRGRHGQNGILLTRCVGTRVYDCDFSFLSGWGLALYRTNDSLVARNRFDHCVRGYSHGVYWRGQDSAGILMFERCSRNVFAENSASHGGDGVFLFAGRDSVEGLAHARGETDVSGSDQNVWWRNDFSYAVANAIEATFSSDNWAIENQLDGSHMHGVWGGYSRRMVVLENSIRDTRGGGVSIEHGQECAIVENEIEGNDIGVELWWDEDPTLVGGPFGARNDTRSRDHLVIQNRFADNAQDLVLKRTTGVAFARNEVGQGSRSLEVEGSRIEVEATAKPIEVAAFFLAQGELPSGVIQESSARAFVGAEPEWLVRARAWTPPELPGAARPKAKDRGGRAGLDTIVMGEWGPWDFESGEPRPAQRIPGGILAHITWDAAWFPWELAREGQPDSGQDPRQDPVRWLALSETATTRRAVSTWGNPWALDADVRREVGPAHFGLVARAKFSVVKGGPHRLSVVSDDGVRVRIDDQVVLENWTWHAATRDEADVVLTVGEHTIQLDYFQIDGAAALSIELEPRDATRGN